MRAKVKWDVSKGPLCCLTRIFSFFLEGQPCHSSVMVLCSLRAIYQGFCQWQFKIMLFVLSPISFLFLILCGEWPSLVLKDFQKYFVLPALGCLYHIQWCLTSLTLISYHDIVCYVSRNYNFLNKYKCTININTFRILPLPAMISLLVHLLFNDFFLFSC